MWDNASAEPPNGGDEGDTIDECKGEGGAAAETLNTAASTDATDVHETHAGDGTQHEGLTDGLGGTNEGPDADENDTPPSGPASELSPAASSVVAELSNPVSTSPGRRRAKQLEKMQRRVPGSLDLDYITPQIIGMAPPRAKVNEEGPPSQDPVQKSLDRQKKGRRQKGNDPGELSTFLERRHPRRYLLFNVSDEDADDRSLLLLGRQVVHLPWGSPRIPHPNDNHLGTPARTPGEPGSPSPFAHYRKGGEGSAAGGGKSSGTPAVSRVMDICYALHAYLSIPPRELPPEMQDGKQTAKRQRKGKHSHHLPTTVACIYCGNGKTRTGVIVACYLRFCNEVPDALSGFEIFCERRGIMSSSSSGADNNDISAHIPPSLRQFFGNFDEVVQRKHYPHPEPLMLQSIALRGIPVDDMPCVDIWEYGDIVRRQIYSSHDDISMNEWDDEEGTYKIGQLLDRDFTLVCRFGGEFAADADDPSKVLFRYVNCPNFLGEGTLDLGMADVDMMRRYADSFDDEDFLLTLVFETVDEEMRFGSPGRKRGMSFSLFGATKFEGSIGEEADVILQGWRVLSDAHLSHLLPEDELELNDDNHSFKLLCQGHEVDFRLIAMQLTNGDSEMAKAELMNGLFKSVFNNLADQPDLDSILQPILEPQDSLEEKGIDHRGSTASTAPSTVGSIVGDDNDVACDADDVFEAALSKLGNGQEGVEESLNESSPRALDMEYDIVDSSAQSKSVGELIDGETSESHEEAPSKEPSEPPQCEHTASEMVEASEIENGTDAIPTQPVHSVGGAADEVCDNKAPSSDTEAMDSASDTYVEGDIASTNTPFADQSQSSLLEAIQMRGLKNSMMSVRGDDDRASLLMEIRHKGSTEEDGSQGDVPARPPSPSAKDGAAVVHSESIDAADYLPSMLVLDTSGVVDLDGIDLDQIEGNSICTPSSDRAVMMLENDQSVSTGNGDISGPESVVDGQTAPNHEGTEDVAMSEGVVSERASHALQQPPKRGATDEAAAISSAVDEPGAVRCPTSPSLQQDPLFEKFYGMLQKGLPMGEVQKAMQRDKVDPKLLEIGPAMSQPRTATAKADNADKSFGQHVAEAPATPIISNLTISALGDSATLEGLPVEGSDSLACVYEDPAPSHADHKHSRQADVEAMESEENDDQRDPRAALMQMLSNRAHVAADIEQDDNASGPSVSGAQVNAKESEANPVDHGNEPVLSEGGEEQKDPRTALMAMLSKRAPPATNVTEKASTSASSTPDARDSTEQVEDHIGLKNEPMEAEEAEEQRDPRAALMAMLNKRAPPNADDEQSGTYSVQMPSAQEPSEEISRAQEAAPVHREEEDEQKDPRAALLAMLSQRNPRPADVEAGASASTPSVSVAQVDTGQSEAKAGAQEGAQVQSDDDEEEKDPRAALMAMLNKRAPPAADAEQPEGTSAPKHIDPNDDVSGQGAIMQEDESLQPPEEEEQKDPRAALMAMLSKRAPPVDDEQPESAPSPSPANDAKSALNAMLANRIQEEEPAKSEDEEEQNDPRAALMTMLSKRAPLPDSEPPNQSVSPPDDDPKIALNALLAKRSGEDGGAQEEEEEEQKDPRAALMAMLSKRAPPAAGNEPEESASSPGQDDDKSTLNGMLTKHIGGDSAVHEGKSGPSDEDTNIGTMAAAAALKQLSLDETAHEAHQSRDKVAESATEKETLPSIREDPRFERYFRMLKMGLPMGAVKNAMQRDQQDPTIMDLDPEKSLEIQRPVEEEEGNDSEPPLDEDPAYEKYFRMLKMGLPLGAVKNAIQRDGLDPDIIDLEANKPVASQGPLEKGGGGSGDDGPPLRKDPAYEKYFRMLKMGLPLGAVKNAMQRDQQDPTIMDLDPEKSLESQRPSEKLGGGSGDDGPPLKEDPAFEKYFKMLKMGLPMGAVKNAMQRDGLDPYIMDLDANKSAASQMKTSFGDSRAADTASAVEPSGQNPSPIDKDQVAANEMVTKHGGRSNLAEGEEEEQKDPRAALMAMLSKRAHAAAERQPQSQPSGKDNSIPDGNGVAEQDREATQDDPRGALMAMLSKRAPPTPAEQAVETHSSTPQTDASNALKDMLTKRGGQGSADDKTQQNDPRASLMAAISNRAPPPPAVENDVQPPAGSPMNIGAMAAAAALKKKAPVEATGDSAEAASKEKDGPPTIREDPRFSKYFRMLKMGLPMGAVKNAMQRDQQDPTIMDLDPEKSLESQRPPEKEGGGDDGPPLKEDPQYSKYFKMLKMGLPVGAVKNALQRDGLDPDVMDLDPNKSVASQMKKDDDGPPLKEDPKYSKYFKMLKMGLPMGAVQNALQRDGLDPAIMDLDPEKSVASQMKEEEEEVDTGPPLKDDPKYSKYFKMLKMGLPVGAVKNAMERDGLDPSIMDLDPEKSVASQMEKEEDTGPPLKDDPKYSKYFKMLKMGLPMGAVKNAMQREGQDPSIMDLDPEKSVASQLGKDEDEEEVDTGPPLKDDPKWTKYFKMLKMGLPMGAVKNALQREGHDPSIMDLDPEKSFQSQQAKPSKAKKMKKKLSKVLKSPMGPKKPKVRRKKLFWSPIEESKIDDNSLWSMVKGTFDFDSLKVDQDEFESLFTDKTNPADKKKAPSEKPAASKQKKSVQVIDAKRGMNGGIILARIKIEFSVLAEMVTEMDCGKLDDTQLMALREFLPTKDERFAIEGYIKGASSSAKTKEAAINDFCACEKYMLAMMNVDMADEKFEAMLFKYQFDNKLNELMDCVTTLINACEEVQKSVRLRKLMAMILMLGNQINTGGSGRMAQGFTLDALLKLDEAKAFDKKTSVLQYLVKLVKANEPDLLNVHEEMPSIGPAENVIVETLVSELNEVNGQLTSVKGTAAAEGRLKREGKVTAKNRSALDRLRQQKTKIKDVSGVHMYNQAVQIELTAMEKFAQYAEKRTKQAFARIEEVQENFKGVLAYFGEDPAMASNDFFGTLNKFIATFDNALEVVKRIEALKIAEEKKEAARKAKEAARKTVKAVAAAKQVSDIVAQQSKGKLDLSGQRKQFADPFAGPDADGKAETKPADEDKDKESSTPSPPPSEPKKQPSDSEQEAKQEDPKAALMATISQLSFSVQAEEPKSNAPTSRSEGDDQPQDPKAALSAMLAKRAPQPQARPPSSPNGSSDTTGFFPATSPHPKGSSHEKEAPTAREQRYETKTSSNARGSEAVAFASPPSSPVARGIKKDLLAEGRLHLHHVQLPNLEEKESEPPADNAADGRKRLNKINPHIEADARTEAKVMLVASMAAAAAKKRSNKPADQDKAQPKENETLFNAITTASGGGAPSSSNESGVEAEPKVSPAGTSAGEKKAEADAEPANSSTALDAMSVGAMAAAAALKRNAPVDESNIGSDAESSAVEAKPVASNDASEDAIDAETSTKLGASPTSGAEAMSIGAMAAAAALKKRAPVEESTAESSTNKTDVEAESNDPPTSAAAEKKPASEPLPDAEAEKEASKQDDKSREISKPVASGAPMGIAAMAAAAARKKNDAKLAEADASNDNGPPNQSEPNTAINAANQDPDEEKEASQPVPAKDAPTTSAYPCSACGEILDRTRFSKNQLSKVKKKEKGRCKQCIEASSK